MNFDLNFYYKLIWRRLPVMLVIFALCTAIGVAMALTMPPRYAADATLLVEGAQIPDDLAESTFRTEAAQQLQIIQTRLMTRANLIDIATKYKVFAESGDISADAIVEAMERQTTIRLAAGRNEATIMTIAFDSGSAQMSADVVNEFVTLVLTEDTEIRTVGSRQTLDFFIQQAERYDRLLSKQSAEIVAFKEANARALPEGLNYRLNRQATLQERVNFGSRDLSSLKEQRDRLVEIGAAAVTIQAPLTPEQQQLAQFHSQLVEWESVLNGEDNPKVKVLRSKVAELERRLAEDGGPVPGNAESMLELQLAQIESDMEFATEEIRLAEQELEELRVAIEATPSVRIKLEELEREYENTQALYNQAVSARAEAETGDQIEVNAKGERVTVIEQAVAPTYPTAPNRKLVAGGGAFVGSALAGLFFVLTELLNRTIRRPIDLTRSLGVQPLATIPFLEEPSVRRRRRFIKALLVGSALIAIPVGLWALHTFYLPLDLLIEMVLERVGI